MMSKKNITTVVIVVIIIAVIAGIEYLRPSHSTKVSQSDTKEVSLVENNARIAMKKLKYPIAKEITTPDGFINSPTPGVNNDQPFTLSDYIGKKVILLEFWTYSCINCQRVIPYLNEWYDKYESDGLVIIGVHTPEFEFEKDLNNVKDAVKKFGIKWPVVLDNDYSTWTAYENRYWPRKYLIDIDGFVVYDHIGEGSYDETEAEIVKLLNERKQVLGESGTVDEKSGTPTGAQAIDPSQIGTPETYLGSSRIQYLVNLPSTSCLSGSCSYTFTDMNDFRGYELSGGWKTDSEYINLQSDTGAIRIAFQASKVNLVAGSDKPVRAKILVDGAPVTSDNAGVDVKNGIVTFQEHQLYNLVDLKGAYGAHTLEIQFLDPGISAFAFTFG